MLLHRLRARMQFSPGSGLAQWCYDQMIVRHGQAVHIRQGKPAEEAPVNEVAGDLFVCDLPLMDEAAAVDALATLSDANVLGVTVPIIDDDDGSSVPSWVEHHRCDHDDDVRSGCVVVARNEGA